MGTPIRRITLFLFGGVGELQGEPRSAGAEFVIAVVGPICSSAMGWGRWHSGSRCSGRAAGGIARPEDMLLLRSASPAATLLLWLGPVNVTLAPFNLVPGFPLDGGRVLR